MKRGRRRRRNVGHTHEQRMRIPLFLLCLGVLGVLLVALQIFFFVQQRTELRDAQNRIKDQQIQSLQNEIRARDIAINRKLAARDEQNRQATCAIITAIPPDGGVVDAFRNSLHCGPYKKPKTKAASSSYTDGTATQSRSSSAQRAPIPGSSATQKSAAAATRTTTSAAAAQGAPKSGSGSTSGGGTAPKPRPSPAPVPVPSPSPAPHPSGGGTVCLLGICLL